MKHTILFLSLFFTLLIGQAQNQISELQKGLIFSTHLDEWGQGRDEVSGVMPTKTDTYNVLGKGGEGRRWLENINTSYSSLVDNARYDFSTGDFTLIASFTPANITDNGKYIISKEAGGIGYGLYQQGNDLYVRIDDNTTDVSAIIGTDVLVVGTKITCEVVFTRAGNAALYLNGSASSSGTVAISTASLTLDNTGALYVGNNVSATAGFTGQIHFTRAFNFALTTDIAYYSRPENPIKATHIGSGATKNVLNLNAEGLSQSTSGYWYDKTNSLTATNSGTTLVIPPASNLRGMYFNGTTSKVVFTGIPTSALGATDRTVSVWICPFSFGTGFQALYTYGGLSDYNNFYVGTNNTGTIRVGNSGVDASPSSSTLLELNIWSNIVVTFSGGSVNYYINNTYSGTGTMASTNTTQGNSSIGVHVSESLYYSNSLIMKVNLWNRVLDLDQRKLIYDTGF